MLVAVHASEEPSVELGEGRSMNLKYLVGGLKVTAQARPRIIQEESKVPLCLGVMSGKKLRSGSLKPVLIAPDFLASSWG